MKSKKFVAALLIIAALTLPSSTVRAWTLTVTGTITADDPAGNALYASPFERYGVSLVGEPYTLTITTDPAIVGTTPYTLRLRVGDDEFVQTEPLPSYTRGYVTPAQINQQVQSNACTWAYGFCVVAYINAYSNVPFLKDLSFEQRTNIAGSALDPAAHVYFNFRVGAYAPGSQQRYSYTVGSIATLKVRP